MYITLLCLEPSLPYYYCISYFQTENRGSSVGRLCRRRRHLWLSWRQRAMPPVALGVVDFAVFGFLWFLVLDQQDIHPINRDSHITEMHMILCILVLLSLDIFVIIT